MVSLTMERATRADRSGLQPSGILVLIAGARFAAENHLPTESSDTDDTTEVGL